MLLPPPANAEVKVSSARRLRASFQTRSSLLHGQTGLKNWRRAQQGEMSELEGLVSLGAGSPQAQAERGEGQRAWQGSRRLLGERES